MTSQSTGTVSGNSRSSLLCMYQGHSCSRPRYRKSEYCVEHILEDESSPFTSCEYLSRTSGRKCPTPALPSKRNSGLPALCEEHMHDLIAKEQHQKRKKKLRKKRKTGKLQESASISTKKQKLMEHVAKIGQYQSKTSAPDSSGSDDEIIHRPISDNWALGMSEDLANNADWDDFDPVNNEVYEPLRYADVLTPEEVVATAQSKLIRLQSLYIEQFKRLFHILKEKRRQYLLERRKEIKDEKMSGASNFDAGEESFDEEEILALANYRRRTGVEALLRKRQKRRRLEAGAGISDYSGKPTTVQSRCSHASNHMRCKSSCLPYTKYCVSHIMEDPHQLLYKNCHTEQCPNAVCFLTSRPYSVESNEDDQDKPKDVCYCSVHAPLPDMSFKFPDERTNDVSMKIDNNAAELPASVDNMESAHTQDNMETEEIMEIDLTPSSIGKSTGKMNSSNLEPTSDDTQRLESAISESSLTQRLDGPMVSSAVPQMEMTSGETKSQNFIDLTMTDGDDDKNISHLLSSNNHSTTAVEIVDLTHKDTIDNEAPDTSYEKDLQKKVSEQIFDHDTASQSSSITEKFTEINTSDVIDLTEDETNDIKGSELSPGFHSAAMKKGDKIVDDSKNSATAESVDTYIGIGKSTGDLSSGMKGSIPIASETFGTESIAANTHTSCLQSSSSLPINLHLFNTSERNLDLAESRPSETISKGLVSTESITHVDTAIATDSLNSSIPHTQEIKDKELLHSITADKPHFTSTTQSITTEGATFSQSNVANSERSTKTDTDNVISANVSDSGRVREDSENENCNADKSMVLKNELESIDISDDEELATASSVSNENNNCSASNSANVGNFQKNFRIVESSCDMESGETDILPTAMSSVSSLIGYRGERKPSSADEEMAVVSLLSLCTGHPSDDNVPSSSTDQE